jgi:hypothetical protein
VITVLSLVCWHLWSGIENTRQQCCAMNHDDRGANLQYLPTSNTIRPTLLCVLAGMYGLMYYGIVLIIALSHLCLIAWPGYYHSLGKPRSVPGGHPRPIYIPISMCATFPTTPLNWRDMCMHA